MSTNKNRVNERPKGQTRAEESRASESRQSEARSFAPYKPASLLSGVPEREGYVRQWIAVKIGNEDQDVAEYFENQGWTPVRLADYPNINRPTMEFGGYQGVIQNGGMILCEIPIERAQEIGNYWEGRAQIATDAIMADAEQNVEGLKKIKTEVGSSVGGKAFNQLPKAALTE